MTATKEIASEHAGLLDIDDVKPFSDADEQCFSELKEVLKRHGALQRFGVSLLHTHFPIHEGEVLVEECDDQNRTLTLRPMKRSEINEENLMQTNWRLDTKSSVQGCRGYCVMLEGRHSGAGHHSVPN